MDKVTSGEELRQRLAMTAGEDIAAFGWGTLGVGNVFAGVTSSALVLELVTLGMRTKEFRRIPFDELEFIFPARGDASTPGYMKMNIQSGISEAMTGTLVFKELTGGVTYIGFRKMPRHDSNDRAPFRITEYISSLRPEKVFQPDLKQYRKKQSFGGCLRTFAVIWGISSVVILLALGFGTGQWETALFGGIGTGLLLGAVFAPMVPVFRRMLSGRG